MFEQNNIDQKGLFYRQLGDNIKSARNAIHMKQEELAEKIGLSHPSIVNIEKGRQMVNVFQLLLLSKALRIEFLNLIPNIDNVFIHVSDPVIHSKEAETLNVFSIIEQMKTSK